jgi:DNA uptake protein ComE-like DNA-binding protein
MTLALALPVAAANDVAKAPQAASSATTAVVDINRASLDELKALKGIGDVRAAVIVKGRPYARKDELVRKGIVPQAVYDDIREHIVARK